MRKKVLWTLLVCGIVIGSTDRNVYASTINSNVKANEKTIETWKTFALDISAPVIQNIEIDKNAVQPGDSVVVTAIITDESEIKNKPYIGFYKKGSQAHTMYLEPQGNNIYKGILQITEDFVNGRYEAGWCNLEDIYSNGGTDYNFDLKYPNLYFEVKNAVTDDEAPSIESIEIDKNEVCPGDMITVTATIKDESEIKNKPYIGFYKKGSQAYTMYLEPQGNDKYKGSLQITEDFVEGKYEAGWCNLEDIYSNGGTDYNFDLKYPELYFVVKSAVTDNEAPVIQNIEIDKNEVQAGDIVTVTAIITDESGVKNKPYIGFYKKGSQVHTMYLEPQGNNEYRGRLQVTEDFVNGKYEAGWCNLEDIYSNGGTDYNFDLKYPDIYFRVVCDKHSWDDGKITKEPTDTANGEKTYICTICGQEKIEKISAIGEKVREGWKKNAVGWWYQNSDKSYPRNQWKQIRGKWYHFDANGYMQTGWLNLGNIWYYLKDTGEMAKDEWVDDGKSYVDINGKYIPGKKKFKEGWKKDSKGWWYQTSDGNYLKSQWKQISEKWYYFDTNGYMQTGWLKLGNTWYYLKNTGEMAKDEWVDDGKSYVDISGKYVANRKKYVEGWKKDSKGWWYQNSDGSYPKNQWKQICGRWYYFNTNGYMKTGWLKLENTWYYLKNTGEMAENEWVEGKYFVDENGRYVSQTKNS